MPLKLSDGSCLVSESDIDDLECVIYSKFEVSSKLMHSQPVQRCPPPGVLYVDQREYAVTIATDDVIDTLGSDDATTCHIAVLRHSGSAATGLCHFDGCGTGEGVRDLVSRVKELSQDSPDGRLELHLIGGFKDDDDSSEQLSRSLLGEFHKLPDDVYLLTACISALNNVLKDGVNYPAIYGIGVSVRTGNIFPAAFEYKGPDKAVRSLRHFIGDKQIMNIYSHQDHYLRVGAYIYSKDAFPHAHLLLQQSDSVLRQCLSTSPAVEPDHFASQVRAAIAFFLSNPSSESVFPDGKCRTYRKRPDGLWEEHC